MRAALPVIKRIPPLPLLITALLFIIAGTVGTIYHASEYIQAGVLSYESILILLIRLLAIACGILLLMRVKWARWLAIAWLAYHVILSAFHSTSEMITHLVLLVIIFVLLFTPASSAYLKKTTHHNSETR